MRMPDGKGKFVTRSECQSAMSRVATDIDTVKCALVGKDLRGGLVKDVADLIGKVDHIIQANQESNSIRLEWKLAIFGAIVTSIIALVGIVIKAAGI